MVNYVVIGGGIAAVCCAEELCRTCPDDSVTLVAGTRILKVRTLLPGFLFFNIQTGSTFLFPTFISNLFFSSIKQGVSIVTQITKTIEELQGEGKETWAVGRTQK
jgi:hypothetical protein